MKTRIKDPIHARHIVVHCTGTRPDMKVKELDRRPYHYLITRSGRLLQLQAVRKRQKTVELAWLGGLDKDGIHTDNRTDSQKETLFTTLVLLTERYPGAEIVPASQHRKYGFPNPGFDIRQWLREFIPAVLAA